MHAREDIKELVKTGAVASGGYRPAFSVSLLLYRALN